MLGISHTCIVLLYKSAFIATRQSVGFKNEGSWVGFSARAKVVNIFQVLLVTT